MKTITRYAFSLLTTSIQLFAAVLTGTIVDQNGNPVSGATVIAVRQSIFLPAVSGTPPQLAPGEVEFGGSWMTDNGGNFLLASIPAGNYLLCVEKRNSPLLDPCVWKTPIAVNGLQGSEQRALDSITAPQGTLIQIAVSDPLGLLPGWDDVSSDGGLIVGIFHGDHVWTPAVRNPDKTLSIAVPTGISYNLWVFSRQFNYNIPGIGSTSGNTVNGLASMSSNGILSPAITAGSEPVGGYQVSITSAKN